MNQAVKTLESGYILRELSEKEFFPQFGRLYDGIFGRDHTFFPDDFYSDEEKTKLKALQARFGNVYRLHLGLYSPEGEFVGFSFGYQETAESFYMIASGVLPEHRRKGLYAAALNHMIEKVSAEGFQIIYSTHCATNNAVIIPKLQAGFVIGKLELSDMFGTIVHLHYYPNPLRRKVMDYRSGHRIPDAELRRVMKLRFEPSQD